VDFPANLDGRNRATSLDQHEIAFAFVAKVEETALAEIGFGRTPFLPAARSMCRNPSRSLIHVPKDD
jgi:hypothetical protein